MTHKAKHFYHFGPYRLDPDRRILLLENKCVPVQPKAFDILLVLVENSENVVAKDDLLKKVWPDTFVEESNLAQNIFVLRKTLGDAVEEKRYIVTVPGRGYRFAEKVTVVDEREEAQKSGAGLLVPDEDRMVVETHTRSHVVVEEQPLPTKMLPAIEGRSLRSIAVAAALGVAVAVALYFYMHRSPKLTEKDTIVLGEFDNKTGDSVFDGTLRQGLSIQLEQSPFLNLLSDQRIVQTLLLMTQPKDSRLSPELAREVCQRTGSAAVLNGAIAEIGSRYLLTLKAVNCTNGDTLASTEAEAKDKDHVLDALGAVASGVRRKLGESLATLQKFDVHLPQATTPSLEALKALSIGDKFLYQREPASAPPYFERAFELDPNFAMAYVQLGLTYYTLSEPGRARECFIKAFSLQAHASERERMEIAALYYAYATGEAEKAIQDLERELEIYRIAPAYNALSDLYARVGQYDKSADAAGKLLALEPSNKFGFINLALADLALENFSGVRDVTRQAQARGSDTYFLHNDLYTVAFLQADSAGMAEQQRWFTSQTFYQNYGLALAAFSEAYVGHVNKARELTRSAVESAVHADNKEDAAMYRAHGALEEAAYGNSAEARQSAAEAVKLAPRNPSVAVQVALAFAMIGDSVPAGALLGEMNKLFPRDTQLQSLGLPAIEAQLQLGRREPELALNTLRAGLPVEFANTTFSSINTSCLYATYIRGQAYLAAGHGAAAAGEFQKILDHRGIVGNCWTGALARLGVGRANALLAKTSQGPDADAALVRARTAYQDFLTLWKDADPKIPTLTEARTESGKLQ
jgi:eukaryotic-like serine/threonine-protein kinase